MTTPTVKARTVKTAAPKVYAPRGPFVMEGMLTHTESELRRLARRGAATEATLKKLIGVVPGGLDRIAEYDALLARADKEPPFVLTDRVRHVEDGSVGEVLGVNDVTDVIRVKWNAGTEGLYPAMVLEKV
jgi:hypothetical protein